MNAGSTTFNGIVAALALIVGGVGCSHNDADHRLSRSERRSQSHSDRTSSGQREVAEAPPLTNSNQTPVYSNQSPAYQTPAAQNNTYSTQVPAGMAPSSNVVVTATAANAPTATYSAPPVVAQEPTNSTIASSTIASDAAAQRQDAAVTVRAPEAPPATKSETPTHSPSNDEFWVNGNWNWNSNTYTWQPGRMERLRANQLYHPATWSQSAQGWDFTPAYWQ